MKGRGILAVLVMAVGVRRPDADAVARRPSHETGRVHP